MAQFKGTSKADKNNGSPANDSLTGLAGSDTLSGGLGNDFIDGGVDNDLLNGENGDDTLFGGDGKDTLIGGSGNDSLSGGKDNDKLTGDAGNDTLNGGAGADTMTGGDGNDYYFVDNLKDFISETNKVVTSGGKDTVDSMLLNYTLPTNVENLILSGNDVSNGTGNKADNAITGNAADNYLRGGEGKDTLTGGAGVDTLDGGFGIDTLIGGDDSDVYFMDNTEDTIIETADGGELDQVNATVSFNLSSAQNVEALELSGANAIDGTGDDSANIIQEKEGGKVANSLNGMGGDDTLDGAGGDDELEGGDGNDILEGGDGTDTAIYNDLQKNYQITSSVGSGVSQIIVKFIGGDGNNRDDGGEGEDILSNIEIIQFSDGTTINTADVIAGTVAAPTETPVDETPIDETPIVETPIVKPVVVKPVTPTVSHSTVELAATQPPEDLVFEFDFSLTKDADTFDIAVLPNAKTARILALGGDDSIQGGTAARWIDGGAGNDVIVGGQLNDTLLGGVGNDSLDSGEPLDPTGIIGLEAIAPDKNGIYHYQSDWTKVLQTFSTSTSLNFNNAYADYKDYGDATAKISTYPSIDPAAHTNVLSGGAGDDVLVGRWGSESLIGGGGVDNLSSGGGADTFIFVKGDSGVGAGNRDVITDFDVSSGDAFNFSAITSGKLSYIGTKVFSATNQVRTEVDFVHSTTIVKLNLDSDLTTTEMEIELTGFQNLTADDFVLVKV